MICLTEGQYRFGELLLEAESGRLFRGQEEICLAPLSRKLLLTLVEHSPAALSHEDLQREVWDSRYVTAATVKQRIKLLRQAIGDDAQAPRYVAMDRGRGYRLIPPVNAVHPTAVHPMMSSQQVQRPRSVPILAAGLATLAILLALLLPALLDTPGADSIHAVAATKAAETGPADAEAKAHYRQARLFYHRRAPGDIARARNRLLQSIAAEPEYAKAWVALAGVAKLQYWQTRELSRNEALSIQRHALERALALDPNLAEAHARLGQLYCFMEESPELAREHFETALKLAPEDPMVLAIYGGYLLQQGDFEKFLAYGQRAVELDPYSLLYRNNLAIVYLKLHRLGDAERELKLAATIHPSMMDSLALEFARLRILQGRAKEVLELLPKLEERSDQLALRAMAMTDLGDVARGKTALAELTKIPGAYARLRQGEAEAYINQSDTTAATLAAMHEAARAGPEALWLANEAIHEAKFSPFLDSGNKSARQAEKKVAALY